MRTIKCFFLLTGVITTVSAFEARAEDAYYRVPLASLKLTEGTLPVLPEGALAWSGRHWGMRPDNSPYAVLDGAGEVFVSAPMRGPFVSLDDASEPAAIFVRTPASGEISGRLFVPQPEGEGMLRLKFKIAPGQS